MKSYRIVSCLLLVALSTLLSAQTRSFTLGTWTVSYHEDSQTLQVSQGKHVLLDNVCPEACYQDSTGTLYYMNSQVSRCTQARKTDQNTVSYTFQRDARPVRMLLTLHRDGDHLLVDLQLQSDQTIRSNYLAPICVTKPYNLFPEDKTSRMLKVPFDNDDFVRYHQYPFGQQMTSFEVAAFYRGECREGLVIGSVDHDHWKSGIEAQSSKQGDIKRLRVFSGISHHETRDVLPHGSLIGKEIRSARFYVGYSTDWRTGMEGFAQACLKVVPGRHNWQEGTPFGWQSWGVMSDKNSFDVDVAVSKYFHDVLQPNGFCNEKGKIVMSIDAWDNLADKQKDQLCEICQANDQIPGTYWTPFCLWWDAKRILKQKLPGQDQYLACDCILKAHGQYIKYDGAYCLDPTHPGVKAWIGAELKKIKAHGFRYLKIDFTDNGMIQADSYYDPNVHTGVEAYNQGFSYFLQRADEGTPLYIALSIAPIFPYQYGNSRRIACDTWGRISHSEYSMNAISGGWWTSLLYQYNDPDHCPLVGNDDAHNTTENENRARYTNLMAAGMALVCDNFDLDDKSGRGDARLSRERAPKILFNREINQIGQLGRSFRPIYGYKEFGGTNYGAESFFQLDTQECTYVAILNYGDSPLQGILPLERLGLKSLGKVKELWTQTQVETRAEGIPYDVPARDARIYRIIF